LTKVLNKKIEPSKEYLVKWVGYKNPTWEPTENLENCQILLNEFLMRKKKNQLKKVKLTKKMILMQMKQKFLS
jgi:hypothetical protein